MRSPRLYLAHVWRAQGVVLPFGMPFWIAILGWPPRNSRLSTAQPTTQAYISYIHSARTKYRRREGRLWLLFSCVACHTRDRKAWRRGQEKRGLFGLGCTVLCLYTIISCSLCARRRGVLLLAAICSIKSIAKQIMARTERAPVGTEYHLHNPVGWYDRFNAMVKIFSCPHHP